MKRVTLLLFLQSALASLSGQSISLSLDRESGIYDRGEPVVVRFASDGLGDADLLVKAWRNNTDLLFEKTLEDFGYNGILLNQAFEESCSIVVEVSSDEVSEKIGAVIDSDGFEPGLNRPADLELFWNGKKSELAALPFEVKREPLEVPEQDQDYFAESVEINCVGPRPARGYLARPVGAEAGTLPIVLLVRAAGVKGSWCRSQLPEVLGLAKQGNGALAFDLNAHGMLNGQPETYYEDLENGELDEYWNQGIESRETYYFLGMYQRLLRTIEFLTRQPEWDGKRILVIGESQGGGQAFAAAGLDSRVTAVVATVPAMCDWGGLLLDRKGGWPQPLETHGKSEDILNTVGYFDTAMLLKGSDAKIVVEVGLIDETCPPTSIFAAINQSSGEKTVFAVPYRHHGWPEGGKRKIWEDTVHEKKWKFISDCLK